MAIHRSVLAFKYYLYNRKFVILSDSKPLKKYKKTDNPVDITAQWLMDFSEYTYTFEHIPGSTNILADYLSRCNFDNNQETLTSNPELISDRHALPIIYSTPNSNRVPSSTVHVNCLISGPNHKRDPLLEISNETFIEEQTKDPQLSCIYKEILQKGCSEKFPKYFIHPDSKVLMFKKENTINNTFSYLIIVSDSLKSKILTISYLSHFGLTETYEFVSAIYFWRGTYVDALNIVVSCTKY